MVLKSQGVSIWLIRAENCLESQLGRKVGWEITGKCLEVVALEAGWPTAPPLEFLEIL